MSWAMAHTSLTEIDPQYHRSLWNLAHDSIDYGLKHAKRMVVRNQDYPVSLRTPRATFVTLKRDEQLRGCIGTLEARRSLVEDIAYNAHAAAFCDPRFSPLAREQFAELDISLSILSPPEEMVFGSESELLKQLRRGKDGLILQERGHRGTFLPSVWESLPNERDFLNHLKIKAGLPSNYWSDTVKVLHYTTQSINHG